jgi:hypothetical protein
VLLACYCSGNQIGLELSAHQGGPFAAHANQPNATAGQRLDRRHADVLGHAADDDHSFIEVEVHNAAHLVTPRVPADSLVLADSAASALRACSSK